MHRTLFIYPAVLMITLTLFLYVKGYLDFVKAKKSDAIKFSYFKTYKGEAPDYLEVSRQTLTPVSPVVINNCPFLLLKH